MWIGPLLPRLLLGRAIGKSKMVGFLASPRGGIVHVEVRGERVILGGEGVIFASRLPQAQRISIAFPSSVKHSPAKSCFTEGRVTPKLSAFAAYAATACRVCRAFPSPRFCLADIANA